MTVDVSRTRVAACRYAAALECLKREHALDCSISATYEGFNEGVALLETNERKSLILKLWHRRSLAWAHQARCALECGRHNMWPSPAWLTIDKTNDGCTFGIQEHVEGQSVSVIDDSLANEIVRVNRRQQDCASPASELIDYNTLVTTVLFEDFGDWLTRVRSYSAGAKRLMDTLMDRTKDAGCLTGNDLMHGDYGRSNFIVLEGTIVGLVDLDNVGWGNRVVDLADAYRQMIVQGDSPSARSIIRSEIEAVATTHGFYAALAFKVISNLAWMIETYPHLVPDNVTKLLAFAESDEY